MKIEVEEINANKCNVSRWLGGTTIELNIYPENSKYSEKNFLYRISTATCDLNKSVFTDLPGIHRELMILEGDIELDHEGRYRKKLKSYDKDTFLGEWKTTSYGSCIDFNLMTSSNCEGELKHFIVRDKKNIVISKKDTYKNVSVGLYLYKGKASVQYNCDKYTLVNKDMLMFRVKDIDNNISIEVNSNEIIDLILIQVYY